MQQTKSYWRFVALAGVVTAFVASACVVTTSTDDNTAGAGGQNTAGANTAGAGAGAGGASTAGTGGAAAGAGGAAPVSYQCDPDSGEAQGTPNTCAPAAGSETDVCAVCVQQKCCTEFSACYATGPGNQCGWGGPNDAGEISCVQTCIQKGVADTGVYDATLVGSCGATCTTQTVNGSSHDCGSVIGQQTNDLVACLGDNCQTECFGG